MAKVTLITYFLVLLLTSLMLYVCIRVYWLLIISIYVYKLDVNYIYRTKTKSPVFRHFRLEYLRGILSSRIL